MAYQSINELQNVLADDLFAHTGDNRKAAGRALGTIVEILAFYLLRAWGLGPYMSLELGIPEFGSLDVSHNVEFALHPSCERFSIELDAPPLPLTAARLKRLSLEFAELLERRQLARCPNQLLSLKAGRPAVKNACLLARNEEQGLLLLATLAGVDGTRYSIDLALVLRRPYAMVECKRVGMEEGPKGPFKGPTTIEKAKQGAYVARHVSALQKVRRDDGSWYAVLSRPGAAPELLGLYGEALDRIAESADPAVREGLVVSVGLASNHGNWFRGDDANKELHVLAQSYDWLLFLQDEPLTKFVSDVLVHPSSAYSDVRDVFQQSYTPIDGAKVNRFTKSLMDYQAHLAIGRYVHDHLDEIETSWFDVRAPAGKTTTDLRDQLVRLVGKEWLGCP